MSYNPRFGVVLADVSSRSLEKEKEEGDSAHTAVNSKWGIVGSLRNVCIGISKVLNSRVSKIELSFAKQIA
jgi:hypothetical protein